MNRMMTSLLAVGLGVAAYQLAQRNDWMNGRTMRRMRRRLMQTIR
ncbi:YrzQ family protein [Geobacillus thermoleovorans]|nr:YrzQ family protein [Geobacillus kaustophilus]